ncbi:MAG: OmpH family outer membrane protein, partial [Pseudomonadota bacterium]
MFLKSFSYSLLAAAALTIPFAAQAQDAAKVAEPATAATTAATTIAIVDLEKVISNSSAGKDLDVKVKAKKSELKTLAEGYQKALHTKEQGLIAVGKKMNPKDQADIKSWEEKKKSFDAEILAKRQDVEKKNAAIVKGEITAIKEIQANVAKITADIALQKKIQIVLDRKAVLIAI